jgi:phenylpropionate dioxygenase-like ring-hydroxylating dioxygenase large terminal subunit
MTYNFPNKARSSINYDSLVLNDRVHSSIYTDPAIFDEEMDRIFRRGWVYIGHESEIPKAGDFQARHIGRQPVIYIRGDDGQVRVLMNRCTHRGAVVCPHENGNAKGFVCAYHGWTFRNTGALMTVRHGERYGESFKKEEYGLRPAPRTATYRGLMFANLSEEGPSLDEHLGPLAKAEIDVAFDLSPTGKIDVSCGIHKYGYAGNWKLQVENATDGYHLGFLHRSFIQIGLERAGVKTGGPDFTGTSPFRIKSLGNGHVSWDMSSPASGASILGSDTQLPPAQKDYVASLVAARGKEYAFKLLSRGGPHVLIFPNLVFIQTHIRMIRPISVEKTEVFLYPYRLDDVSSVINTFRFRAHQAFYGPAGGGATDDLEVFERITEGLRATVDPWILIERGFGRERVEPDGSISGQITDELNNRAILQYWKQAMSGSSALSKEARQVAL